MSDGADGLLVLDKPPGWTSHDVVARVRRLCGTRRVGHAGTLDPMATGVLVLGVNRATRLLTFLVGCDKEYAATIRLGRSTTTDDAEGAVVTKADASRVGRSELDAALTALTGPIQQVPSAVSAVKVGGQRAYARARRGEDVRLAARSVTVRRFDVVEVRAAGQVLDVDVEVEVSSGTYVRALARDLGAALGVGGHLTALRRTRVGAFHVAQAHDVQALLSSSPARHATPARHAAGAGSAAGAEPGRVPLLSMAAAARALFPVHELTEAEAQAVGHGRPISPACPGEPVVAAIAPDGRLAAVLDESGPQARARAVFAPSGVPTPPR